VASLRVKGASRTPEGGLGTGGTPASRLRRAVPGWEGSECMNPSLIHLHLAAANHAARGPRTPRR